MLKLFNAIHTVTRAKWLLWVGVGMFLFTLVSYYIAIEISSSIEMFMDANSLLFASLQIVFILLNSIAASVSVMFTIYVLKRQKVSGGLTTLQTLGAIILSVGTTGCYVCGTLLLPLAGMSVAFAGLPFAGLEIKVVTLLLFVLSIWELTPRVLGICNLEKTYELRMGRGSWFVTNNKLRNIRFTTISILTASLIFILPAILPKSVQTGINETGYRCEIQEQQLAK